MRVRIETMKEARRIHRRPACGAPACPNPSPLCHVIEVLSHLLWDKRHRVAELFETVDVVTLDTCLILLGKVISA